MTDSCLFCDIIKNEAKANIVFSDELVIAFRDIHPVAPTHILIVPRRHIQSLNDIRSEDEKLIGHMFIVARQIANQDNIQEGGYRIIVNTGPDGRQTVFHLHLHLIGGHRMKHPMG